MARAEGIITSVIFEHALRIQLRDEGAAKKKAAAPSAPSSESGEAAPAEDEGEGEDEGETKGNLVGRITNLVRVPVAWRRLVRTPVENPRLTSLPVPAHRCRRTSTR